MFNHVTLVGRLTKDPELRYTPEGAAVTTFTLAMNRPFKNASGEYEPDFVQCIVWRAQGEATANHCKRGTLVGVSGRIQSRTYDNSEGKRIYFTEVVADRIRFIDRKNVKENTEDALKQHLENEVLNK